MIEVIVSYTCVTHAKLPVHKQTHQKLQIKSTDTGMSEHTDAGKHCIMQATLWVCIELCTYVEHTWKLDSM